jgi:hypothetical protein
MRVAHRASRFDDVPFRCRMLRVMNALRQPSVGYLISWPQVRPGPARPG